MAPSARRILLEALVQEAYTYKTEPFTLKSGAKSHHYVDCRRVLLDPTYRGVAGALFTGRYHLATNGVDAIAGVAVGGVPVAATISDNLELPLIIVRPEAKEHGTKKLVEASWSITRGATVLLIEDVVTTGGSSLHAVKALRDEGYKVTDVFALVDRGEGGLAAIAGAGCRLHRIFTLAEIADAAGLRMATVAAGEA
jgi:orotate phosphoribosyltransferase